MTYNVEDFADVKAPPKPPSSDVEWEDGVNAKDAYQKALGNGLTKKAIKLLKSKGAGKHDGPSEADFACMGYLYRAGLTPGENAAVIFAHPRGADIAKRHPDTRSYMKLSLGKLYTNGSKEEPSFESFTLAEVEGVFSKWLLLEDYKALHSGLATVAAHRAGGDGLWTFIVDAPGSGKTEVIRALNGLSDVVPLSSLTPSTFASGMKVSDSSKDPSLLLRLPERPIVTLKDFTTVLSMNRDSRQEILAQLRELADGYYTKEFGNGKSVSWKGTMCFIAGVTTILDTHWAVSQTLGERFVQARPAAPDPFKVAERAMQNVGREKEMHDELDAAVAGFLGNLEYRPIREIALNDEMTSRLANLATYACRARSAVVRDGYKQEITYIPVPEGPARLARQLSTLARGLTLIKGEVSPTTVTFNEVIEIGMDCIPPPRRKTLDALLAGTVMSTTEVSEQTGYPVNSARRILEELMAIGMATRTLVSGTYDWRASESAKTWHDRTSPIKVSKQGLREI